jgi:hypothetical protein
MKTITLLCLLGLADAAHHRHRMDKSMLERAAEQDSTEAGDEALHQIETSKDWGKMNAEDLDDESSFTSLETLRAARQAEKIAEKNAQKNAATAQKPAQAAPVTAKSQVIKDKLQDKTLLGMYEDL